MSKISKCVCVILIMFTGIVYIDSSVSRFRVKYRKRMNAPSFVRHSNKDSMKTFVSMCHDSIYCVAVNYFTDKSCELLDYMAIQDGSENDDIAVNYIYDLQQVHILEYKMCS